MGTIDKKIMTWQFYKKNYKPQIYTTPDSLFGTLQVVSPTMKRAGFTEEIMYDVPVYDKPLNVIKESFSSEKYETIVYYPWMYRDNHGKAISVYYKLKPQDNDR